MTKDELFDAAEEWIIAHGQHDDPFFSLIEAGMSEEDADRVSFLVSAAIVTIDWPDNV